MMIKKITLLVAMLALMIFSALPAFAEEIEVDDGDITITNTDAELFFVEDEDSALFDALCSPLVDINLNGCIFSEDEEEEDFVFVLPYWF
jgi:hypothetical protein